LWPPPAWLGPPQSKETSAEFPRVPSPQGSRHGLQTCSTPVPPPHKVPHLRSGRALRPGVPVPGTHRSRVGQGGAGAAARGPRGCGALISSARGCGEFQEPRWAQRWPRFNDSFLTARATVTPAAAGSHAWRGCPWPPAHGGHPRTDALTDVPRCSRAPTPSRSHALPPHGRDRGTEGVPSPRESRGARLCRDPAPRAARPHPLAPFSPPRSTNVAQRPWEELEPLPGSAGVPSPSAISILRPRGSPWVAQGRAPSPRGRGGGCWGACGAHRPARTRRSSRARSRRAEPGLSRLGHRASPSRTAPCLRGQGCTGALTAVAALALPAPPPRRPWVPARHCPPRPRLPASPWQQGSSLLPWGQKQSPPSRARALRLVRTPRAPRSCQAKVRAVVWWP